MTLTLVNFASKQCAKTGRWFSQRQTIVGEPKMEASTKPVGSPGMLRWRDGFRLCSSPLWTRTQYAAILGMLEQVRSTDILNPEILVSTHEQPESHHISVSSLNLET